MEVALLVGTVLIYGAVLVAITKGGGKAQKTLRLLDNRLKVLEEGEKGSKK